MKAVLVLEDGTYFSGENFGQSGTVCGEVVFNTSMAGYQEIITDPSYSGQMVCMTYPLIGNYGMNDEDMESCKTPLEGFIVKELCDYHSNFRATTSPNDFFKKNNIVGIKGIDTRLLTQHIRQFGSMPGIISTECGNIDKLLNILKEKIKTKRNLVMEVTTNTPTVKKNKGPKVCLLDLGTKKNIIDALVERDCEVEVLPANTNAEEILKYKPDGIVLSSGPGDPRILKDIISTAKELVNKNIPIFGISLGHQILALAFGLEIYKMKFGHHGSNQAVKELMSQKCYMTNQNHNYAVKQDNIQEGIKITHINVNDNTVEGFTHESHNIISVQYNPKSTLGPEDSAYIYNDFIEMMKKGKKDA